jgi:hypothetical protein
MSITSRARQAAREAAGEVRPTTSGRRNRASRYVRIPKESGGYIEFSDGTVYRRTPSGNIVRA